MTRIRSWVLIYLSATISSVLLHPTTVRAQSVPDLTGHWTLNRALIQMPQALGFDADDFQQAPGPNATARLPPADLIVETSNGRIKFCDGRDFSRTFHPTGNEQVIDLGGLPVASPRTPTST